MVGTFLLFANPIYFQSKTQLEITDGKDNSFKGWVNKVRVPNTRCYILDGTVSKDNMTDFIKMIKKTSRLNDEEAAKIAAIKIHEATPKSRMYYKINAQRELGGGKKVNPTSNMPARLKVRGYRGRS